MTEQSLHPLTALSQGPLDATCSICRQEINGDYVYLRGRIRLGTRTPNEPDTAVHIACFERRYGTQATCRTCDQQADQTIRVSYVEEDGTLSPLPLCGRCFRIGQGFPVDGEMPGDDKARVMAVEQTARARLFLHREQ